jgi:ABC-type polysaccharide/polyol phosphate transport system ATPase subunit
MIFIIATIILNYIKYRSFIYYANLDQIIIIIQTFAISFEQSLFTIITMPIRTMVIHILRSEYINKVRRNYPVGYIINHTKRIAASIPAIQMHVIAMYVNIWPLYKYCMLTLKSSDNMQLSIIIMFILFFINIAFSIAWFYVKRKTFIGADMATEKVRFFIENHGRVAHSSAIRLDTDTAMLNDLRLYGSSITNRHWIRIAMQCSVLIACIALSRWNLYNNGLTYLALFTMHQNNLLFNLISMIASIDGLPIYNCSKVKLITDRKLEHIVFNDVSYMSILKNISFKLEFGGIYAVYGNNGSGKTTLAQLISQRIEATSGYITLPESTCVYLSNHNEISNNEILMLQQAQLMSHIAHKSHFSMAEKNILSLHCAIKSTKKRIIILDETLDTMDHRLMSIAWQLIYEHRHESITIIISHHQNIIHECHHRMHISDGQVKLG